MNKKSTLSLNILTLILTIFITLFLLELTVRIYYYGIINTITGKVSSIVPMSMSGMLSISDNKHLGYELKPDIKGLSELVPIKTNSSGFRDYEYKIEKSNNTFRIIALGDSITFGTGVKFNQIYLKRLEKRLNNSGFTNKYEVMNLAVPGYNSAQELEILKKKALKYKPNLLILGYYLNDIFPPIDISADLKFSFKGFFYQHSHLFRLIYERIRNSRKKISYSSELAAYYRDDSENWIKQKKIFREFKEISKNNNFKILFLLIPQMTELNKTHHFININIKIIKEAKENGFLVLDLLPFFYGQETEKLWIYKTDKHPNYQAHKIISDAVYNFLVKENLNASRLNSLRF